MRVLYAVVAIALLTVPAQTQDMGTGRGSKHQQNAKQTGAGKTTKADDQASKDALKRIPASPEKYDPWRSMSFAGGP